MTLRDLELSIIVPLFNEEENVELLLKKILDSVKPLKKHFEIIFVDDGSTDQTFQKAKMAVSHNPELKVVRFTRNFGQTPAMVAGIQFAKGQVLVTMDGDLQNDPADIEMFLKKIEEGYDLVFGWRYQRQDRFITRKLPSIVANWLIAKVTGVSIRDNGCSLKAYKASVIKKIPLYSEMHRFIPAMSSMAGIRFCELKVRHHARQFGSSKYGLARIYKVALDLLTIRTILSTLAGPLKYFGMLSMLTFVIGLIMAWLSVVYSSFIFFSVAAIVWMTSAIFLFWGVLCEHIVATGDIKSSELAMLTSTHSHT